MKKVNWNIKVEPRLDETVEKYIEDIKKNNVYLTKTQLLILSVTYYMKVNPPSEK